MKRTRGQVDGGALRLRRAWPVWIVLAVGVATTGVLVSFLRTDAVGDARQELATTADQVAIEVQERLSSHELVVRGAAGLLAGSDEVDRSEWTAFASQVDAERVAPGLQGLGLIVLIAPEDLAAHEASVQAEGFPGYRVHPAGDRAVYSSIVYIEPTGGRNTGALGYDMLSEPTGRAAMERARDTGAPTLSERTTLIHEAEGVLQTGVVMYAPVYRRGAAVVTVEQRREAHSGWIVALLSMTDFTNGVFTNWAPRADDVTVRAFQGSSTDASDRLFAVGAGSDSVVGAGQAIRTLTFNGRQWTLRFDPSPGSEPVDFRLAWAALLSGLVATALLGGLVLSLRTTGTRATSMASNLTSDLRQRDAALERSRAALEQRSSDLEEAQRIAGVGSWRLRPATGEVEWSRPLFELFGMDASSTAPPFDEQPTLFTPESWRRLATAVDACIEHEAAYELELEAIRTDGEHRWMVARGEASRVIADQVVEIHGIAHDVTERRRARLRVEHLTGLYRALSECNAALFHADDARSLYQSICEIVVRHAGVSMAWVGEVDRHEQRVTPVCWYGGGAEHLHDIEISTTEGDPLAQGPTRSAIRTGTPVWSDQFETDLRAAPWRERGVASGWRSSAALPIVRAGEVVAVLRFYSDQERWQDVETKQLIERIASEIGYALDKLDADARLRESEQRFRSLVEQSIAGAYIVQDGRIVYVNPRFKEILGYEPDDDLVGADPTQLIVSDDRDGTLMRARHLGDEQPQAVEATLHAVRKDGTLVEVGTHSSAAVYRGEPAVIGLMQDLSDRAVAEAHIRRYADELQRVLFQTVGLVTSISEMRDPYTSGHEGRVAELAVAIGRELGWDEAQLVGLRVGGQLHDVGKISVPAEILVKPSSLSQLETSMVREHARVGFEILKSVEFPWPVARIALEHHEHIDGTGYPQGLTGEQICPEARIITVADVVESMSSHRPYRAALGLDAALDEINDGAGTKYDSNAVDACTRLLREGRFVLGEQA